ncbi:hypothetical protein LptCag_1910 [Leptospirillum ferriphilum]|uniref:Uncharacterized protein n=1 Tax=Leptospirillum ferriphilum TaxID=178606 RepID=A0A094W9M7_9BACT|nr:hypothetical protein LptCag_1910 [Leptospirillum ferriphilum]
MVVWIPWIKVRVVWATGEVAAIFSPTIALTSVDFPEFGRPTRDTNPEREWALFGACSSPTGKDGMEFFGISGLSGHQQTIFRLPE